MKRFINWLKSITSPRKASPDPMANRPGVRAANPRATVTPKKPIQAETDPQADYVDLDPHIEGRIDDLGPGKNVLIRNPYFREDSGTHESLKILDDSMIDTDEEEGFDPYNTGQFDRSKNWDKRRK